MSVIDQPFCSHHAAVVLMKSLQPCVKVSKAYSENILFNNDQIGLRRASLGYIMANGGCVKIGIALWRHLAADNPIKVAFTYTELRNRQTQQQQGSKKHWVLRSFFMRACSRARFFSRVWLNIECRAESFFWSGQKMI